MSSSSIARPRRTRHQEFLIMAVPVLLTIAALGGGYLALAGREAASPGVEASAPSADTSVAPVGATAPAQGAAGMFAGSECSGPVPVGDNPVAGSVGAVATLAPSELGATIDPTVSIGADPATTGSAPVIMTAQAPSSSAAVPAELAEPASERELLVSAVVGKGQTLSRLDESRLYREFGPLAGAVW